MGGIPLLASDRSEPAHSGAFAAAGRRNSAPYITSGAELAAHLGAPDRKTAYARLLTQLGIDGGPEALNGRRDKPALLFLEQPGCWLTALDLARARLRRALASHFGFDADASGLFSLGTDRLTSSGDKAVFLRFTLFTSTERLGPAHLIGSSLLRRHQQTIYDTLPITGPLFARLAAIWGYSLLLLEAAALSRDAFADAVGGLFQSGVERGVRSLLPANSGREQLRLLADKLRSHDLAAARDLMHRTRAALVDGVSWTAYWDSVNRAFLSEEVRPMGPAVSRYLLAVSDPVRMARGFVELSGQNPLQSVSVAGFVDEDRRFRTVNFEPADGSFYYERGEERRPIDWEEVRARAADHSARPSGPLLYLLLAASSHYMIVDPDDELQPFQEIACAAHARATGLKYPWIRFTLDDGTGRSGVRNTFLSAYGPDFEPRVAEMVARFVGPS